MKKQTENIELQLSIEEVNTILDALGQLPFVQVYNLIGSIQKQAAQQLNPENGSSQAPGMEVQAAQKATK